MHSYKLELSHSHLLLLMSLTYLLLLSNDVSESLLGASLFLRKDAFASLNDLSALVSDHLCTVVHLRITVAHLY